MALGWYVAVTHHRAELVAHSELTKQGVQAFLPRERISKIVRGYPQENVRPIFGGYIFTHFDIEQQAWRFINSTRGIKSLISSSPERPTRIRPEIMSALLARCDGEFIPSLVVDEVLADFIPIGATVKLTGGTWHKFRGPVTSVLDDRIKIMLQLFGRPNEVTVPRSLVELV